MPVPQTESHLDEARYSGCRLKVTDVSFQRSDVAGLVLRALFAQHCRETFYLC